MTDINPLMTRFPINIEYSLIFIVFLGILYFLYKFLNKPEEAIKKIEKKIVNKEALAPWFHKNLDNLEKNLNSKTFYKDLLAILREILEYKWQKNISKMTLKEINETLSLTLSPREKEQELDLIKNIYFKEYMKNFEDSENTRKNLILEVKKLIK